MGNDYAVRAGESLINQYEEQKTFTRKTTFDAKNYLNVRLGPNESTKKLRIRILPFDLTTNEIFHKVWMHQVRVNKEVSASGWKNFVCPPSNHLGEKCPFCELSEFAKSEKARVNNQADVQKFGDIEYQNKRRDMWIVRCIERGHEDDGVKFWMFNSSKKHDGIYDKMYNLFKERWDSAKEKGKVSNIFDIYEGKDLIINISKDTNGKNVFQVTDDEDKSPLSTDEEKIQEWLNDEKKWTDVYTVKSYDYMEVVRDGYVPAFDKNKNKFVKKEDLEKETKEEEEKRIAENFTEDTSGIDVTKKPDIFDEPEEDLPF